MNIVEILRANGGEMSSRRLQRASELLLDEFLREIKRLEVEGKVYIGAGTIRLLGEGKE